MQHQASEDPSRVCQMLAEGLAKSRKALEDTTEDHLPGCGVFA